MPNFRAIGDTALKTSAAGVGGVAAVDEAIIAYNLILNLLRTKYKMDDTSSTFIALSCSISTLAAVASTEMKATADEIPHALKSLFHQDGRSAISKSLVGENYTRLPGSFLGLLLAAYYEISIFVLSKEEAEKLFHNEELAISIAACNVGGHLCLEIPTFLKIMGDTSEYLGAVVADTYTRSNQISVLSDIKKNLSLSHVLASIITLIGTMGMMGKLALDFGEFTEHHFSHEASQIAARSAFYIGMLMAQGKIAASVAHTLDSMFNKISYCVTSHIGIAPALPEESPLLPEPATQVAAQTPYFPSYLVVPGYLMLIFLAGCDSLAFGLSNMQGIAEGLEKRFNLTTGFNETFEDPLFHATNTSSNGAIETVVQALLIVGFTLGLTQRLFFQGRAIIEEVPHVAHSIIAPCWKRSERSNGQSLAEENSRHSPRSSSIFGSIN